MKDIQDSIQQILGFTPEVLVVVFLILLGYAVRFMPFIPNKWIPAVCMFSGMVIYTAMVKPPVIEGVRMPHVRMALIGFILGVLAWVIHNKALKKLEDKWLKTGDTTTFTKNETKPYVEPPPAP